MTISGAVAQLGERMNGIHEVEGSTPFGSTSCQIKLEHTIATQRIEGMWPLSIPHSKRHSHCGLYITSL